MVNGEDSVNRINAFQHQFEVLSFSCKWNAGVISEITADWGVDYELTT